MSDMRIMDRDAAVLERERARQKDREKREMEETKRRFDERMNELADLVLEYQETRGLEDPITVMLTNFLDAALRMQEVTRTVEAISLAMDCVTEGITFIDSLNSMDSKMMEQTMQEKYTFRRRMQQKRMFRRTIKNHQNRIRQMFNGLKLKMQMSQEMVRQMEGFSRSMQGAFGGRRKKKDAQPPLSATTSAFLAERAKARSGDAIAAGGGTAPAPAGGPTPPAGGGDVFDGIL